MPLRKSIRVEPFERCSFDLAIAAFPHQIVLIQKEIEKVFGRGRTNVGKWTIYPTIRLRKWRDANPYSKQANDEKKRKQRLDQNEGARDKTLDVPLGMKRGRVYAKLIFATKGF